MYGIYNAQYTFDSAFDSYIFFINAYYILSS